MMKFGCVGRGFGAQMTWWIVLGFRALAFKQNIDEVERNEIGKRSKMKDGLKSSNQSPCVQISSYRPGWP